MLLDIWVKAYKDNINEVRRDTDSQVDFVKDAMEDIGGVKPGEVAQSKKVRGVSKKSSLIAVNQQGIPRVYSPDPRGKEEASRWASTGEILGYYPELDVLKTNLDDIYAYAAQVATVLSLPLEGSGMRNLSRYIKSNYGDIQNELKNFISEARQSFEFEDQEKPAEIASKFVKALEKSNLFSQIEMEPLKTAVEKAVEDDVLTAPTTKVKPAEKDADLSKYDDQYFEQSKRQLLNQIKSVTTGNRRKFLFDMLRNQVGLEGKQLEDTTQQNLQSFEKVVNSTNPDDLTDFISNIQGLSDEVKKYDRQLRMNTRMPLEESKNTAKNNYYAVGFNLSAYKKHHALNEGYLQLFGGWLQYVMKAMFGNLNIPVNITGTRSEVDSLVQSLTKERSYLDTVSKYGLDDERTYKSKSKLDKAVKNFERETGLKWPFN